ncbi:antitoxin [Streptomyces sp. NPDC050658]|uniref:antitoxin n=1 Tax=unclassified Streptomyces TaxID=2593676 RepID=UPI00342F942F
MGFLEKLKDKLAPAKDKVSGLAQQHGDKIDQGLDKAAKVVDAKTKGKYSDKIQTGTGKAKDAAHRLAAASGDGKDTGPGTGAGTGTDTGNTPPTPPSTP